MLKTGIDGCSQETLYAWMENNGLSRFINRNKLLQIRNSENLWLTRVKMTEITAGSYGVPGFRLDCLVIGHLAYCFLICCLANQSKPH
jgi:hypothetical protein